VNKRRGPATGEVRLSDISQLFDTLAPFPFPVGPRWKNSNKDMASAVSRYFDYRAGFIGRGLKGAVQGRTVVAFDRRRGARGRAPGNADHFEAL
jgi:hypothetical protein